MRNIGNLVQEVFSVKLLLPSWASERAILPGVRFGPPFQIGFWWKHGSWVVITSEPVSHWGGVVQDQGPVWDPPSKKRPLPVAWQHVLTAQVTK